MKALKTILSIILAGFILSACSSSSLPYDVEDGYIFIQKESRRNDSTEWKLVWEDQFEQGLLDTTQWSRIGLFTSPPWNTTVDKWQEVTNCFRYISATDNRVVQFDKDNIRLRGIVNTDTLNGEPRPYLTGGIYSRDKFAFQYGRIEIRASWILLTVHGLLSGCCQRKKSFLISITEKWISWKDLIMMILLTKQPIIITQ